MRASLRLPELLCSSFYVGAELLIYDAIGQSFWEEGITASSVVNFLAELDEDVEEVTVRINSPGGSVPEGTAIYNALRKAPQRVVAHVDGVAASMASVIAMAADEIHMSKGSMMMVHNAHSITMGNAKDHEDAAKVLRSVSGQLAGIYADRAKRPSEEIQALMDSESWLTAEDAVKEGLADFTEEPNMEDVAASLGHQIKWGSYANHLLDSYKNTPKVYKNLPEIRKLTNKFAASTVKGNKPVDQEKISQLRAALGLHPDAKWETILAAAEGKAPEAPANVEASVNLLEWVPREEYNALSNRVQELESSDRNRAVEDKLASARAAHKIQSPAYEAALRQQLLTGSLTFEAFDSLMEATPATNLTQRDEVTSDKKKSEEGDIRAKCEALGLDGTLTDYCIRNNKDPEAIAKRHAARTDPKNRRVVKIA